MSTVGPLIPTAPVAVLSLPPDWLARFAVGARLEGLVAALGLAGTVRLKTPLGFLELATAAPLKVGAQVTFQIAAQGPKPELRILTVDGRALAPGTITTAGMAPQTRTDAATDAAALAPRPLVQTTVGAVVMATVAKPSPLTAAVLDAIRDPTRRSPDGTALPTPRANATPGTAATTLPRRPGATPGPLNGATVANTPPNVFDPDAPPEVGARFAVRIIAIDRPDGPTPRPTTAPSLVPGARLAATVVDVAPGRTVADTALGDLIIEEPLPKDARVLFEIVRAPVRPVAAALATPLGAASPASHDWSALGEAIGALATAQPDAARNLLATVMPRPDTRLGATALLFLSALKGGDIQTWIGVEAAHAVERARSDLLPRITEEFRQAARNADEPVAGDWRFVPVPFWDGAELRPIRLFTRPYRGKDENDKPGKRIGTRFIVDLDLTRLGRLQLDGLVRDGNKRFDLIVRSVELLPEFMRDDIRRLFAESCELVGMKGGASFQAAAAFVEIEATPVAGPGILA